MECWEKYNCGACQFGYDEYPDQCPHQQTQAPCLPETPEPNTVVSWYND